MFSLFKNKSQCWRASMSGMLWMIMAFPTIASEKVNLHKQIERGAHDYLMQAIGDNHGEDNIVVEVSPVDDRIQIPACPTGFQYHADSESLSQAYISVRVSCNNNQWYVFTNGRVTRTRSVVVTSGMVSPGTVLTKENLMLADIDIKWLRHTAYSDLSQLIGARMKHRVRQGQPIQANMLCFVCKGDRITISARTSGMLIKTAGIAQQDGVVGESIRVTNASSQKSVIAEVANTNEVIVSL
ncbi:flagellar basal body P-ring formation chaperone FlgA [Alteromonas sp. ASW11-130]|uniref:flagellar basal body P-ring formation chaperone FlgA n=1 Tax=Alteromonas sp. ASW11-130 TaxID=3015775 RepID=UPI002241B534|nr:flagellar basal body P-ring formation chaperone FlgA [Alteromonas sp. ASW11-130]MCW8091819.1 flagellar basal body P-ring formation chaperone FlgA [Alteromonas sp. ASW11-130]